MTLTRNAVCLMSLETKPTFPCVVVPAPGGKIQYIPADSPAAIAWVTTVGEEYVESIAQLRDHLAHLEGRIEHLEVTLLAPIVDRLRIIETGP